MAVLKVNFISALRQTSWARLAGEDEAISGRETQQVSEPQPIVAAEPHWLSFWQPHNNPRLLPVQAPLSAKQVKVKEGSIGEVEVAPGWQQQVPQLLDTTPSFPLGDKQSKPGKLQMFAAQVEVACPTQVKFGPEGLLAQLLIQDETLL